MTAPVFTPEQEARIRELVEEAVLAATPIIGRAILAKVRKAVMPGPAR